MSLQGSLPDFTVVDVLYLLEATGKTGVVRFSREQGPTSQSGSLYFRDGKPVAAETDGLVGERALELLCSWDSGSFVYRDGATSPRENLERPARAMVEWATAAMSEWREIRQALPEPFATVHLAAELPAWTEEVKLGREEWSLLARMIRLESLSTWAQQAGGGLGAHRVLRKLAEKGLLRVESRESGVES